MLTIWVIKNFAFTEHRRLCSKAVHKDGITDKPFTGNL